MRGVSRCSNWRQGVVSAAGRSPERGEDALCQVSIGLSKLKLYKIWCIARMASLEQSRYAKRQSDCLN